MKKHVRPFLKWAGSKYNCLERILASLPEGKRLIEPFTGSGVVFMNTNYSAYILGESNSDLVQLFNTVQKEGLPFIDYCQQLFHPEANIKSRYYELRDEFNQLEHSKERAALFLYLNRHGYNGLCRYNSKGGYNVPFGLYAKPYFPLEEMIGFHHKSNMHKVQFINDDFRKTFELAKKGDVIYCDPPYVLLTPKATHLPYTQKPFTEEDHIELAELAKNTAAKGIPVIISNHDTAFTQLHYKNAEINSFRVSRFISCLGDGRQPVKELIAVFR